MQFSDFGAAEDLQRFVTKTVHPQSIDERTHTGVTVLQQFCEIGCK